MALESRKNKKLSREDIVTKAVELDLRRQAQIGRQTQIINRLLTENQMMMGLLGEIAGFDGNLFGLQGKAKEILSNIQQLRESQQEEDK